MDKFEGGGSMIHTPVTQTPTPQTQAMSMPRSEEVILSHEAESSLVQTEQKRAPEVRQSSKDVADRLLSDTKEIGIAHAFKKLGFGGYRSEKPDNTDNNLSSFEDFKSEREQSQMDNSSEDESIDTGSDTEAMSQPTNEGEVEPTIHSRKKELVGYVAAQVEADPLMKQKLGEVASEMIDRGETIDPEVLREEALKRYIEEKENGEPLSLEDKVSSIEEQFSELFKENAELRNELKEFKLLVKQQAETMNTMALALLEMAKKLHKEKEDEKEKTTLLELLIQLMGLLLQEMTSRDEDKKNEGNDNKIELNLDVSKLAIFTSKKDRQEQPTPVAA